MAKLPPRYRAVVWLYRRTDPDEVFLQPRESKGHQEEGPLILETQPGESLEQAARRAVAAVSSVPPLLVRDMGLKHEFTVKKGPSAGEYSERMYAAELPADARTYGGRWVPHYTAKAEAPVPRWRDAITQLRAEQKLKP